MGVPGSANLLLLGGEQGYKISRSLRFNSGDSAYLNRTPGSTGNRKTWTWSLWLKRTSLGTQSMVWSCGGNNVGGDSDYLECFFNSSNKLGIGTLNGVRLVSTQVFRDPSAWMHLVVKLDTTQATVSNRLVVYVNNFEITAWDTDSRSTYFTQNSDQGVNRTEPHLIGRQSYSGSDNSNHYLAEVQFIDGQALTPSSFGETDTITGVWKPKKYAGTYGTNGFYLNFSDNSGTTSTTLGKDSSGNGNNWTPNNFSVTAGAGNDSLIDTPTPYADGGNGRGNYCTLNPLWPSGGVRTFANGNLEITGGGTSANSTEYANWTVSSGKWYYEATLSSPGATNITSVGTNSVRYRADGTFSTSGSGASYTSNDVIGVAFDIGAGTVQFYKNGSSQGTVNVTANSETTPQFTLGGGSPAPAWIFNFGARPFAYTPPSGFVALNTQNLPEPSIKKPGSYMDVKLYTGTSSTQSITGLGFSPDLVWVKNRGSTNSHALFDSARGAGYRLSSNETTAQVDNTAYFTAFTSDGFTVASNGGETNLSANTYVAWCWDESATPGFDIVTYTGQSGDDVNRTINHNLGVTPSFIVIKNRDWAASSAAWAVWHQSETTKGLLLDVTDSSSTTIYNEHFGAQPTSTTFTTRSGTGVSTGNRYRTNGRADGYVAYLWSEVAGFSKFGSYTGNGSSDGPFCFCGFRPRWVMIKRSDSADYWWLKDSARSPSNPANLRLAPNYSNAEADDAAFNSADFLSNGFKLRGTDTTTNASGGTYVFAAFSESPFKYSLAR